MVWLLLYFCDFVHFRYKNSVRATRLSSISDCVVSFHHSTFGLSSFSVKATTHWNALPEDIKGCTPIGLFKLKLKSFFFFTDPTL